jgi:hypothetical protein
MRSHFSLLPPALVLILGCETTATQVTTFRCTAGGLPPPTDCAFVQAAARDPDGNPVGFLPVRVDSMVPTLGQAYLSGSTISAGDGGFTLLVFRMNRFQQPPTPDTTTVYVKGYASPDPAIGAPAISSAGIVMRFSPLGETVIPTVVPAVFHPIATP